MCYQFSTCKFTSSNVDSILIHTIDNHFGPQTFSFRKKVLDENTGHTAYRSVHFGIEVTKLKMMLGKGYKPNINLEEQTICFKRCSSTMKVSGDYIEQECQTELNNELYDILPNIETKLKEIGRYEDFISVLKSIASGILTQNIAFHLLLDVGRFYSQSTIYSTRYVPETLAFWITIKKLFKGKGVNFFRGYKAQGISAENAPVKPTECKINFAVPSDPVLTRECVSFLADAEKTGMLHTSLDAFTKNKTGQDVKLSIDGKKLACGLGVLGDEDLCGFENPPTLSDRKRNLEIELNTLKEVKDITETNSIDNTINITDLDKDNILTMKQAILISITNLSIRIKDLRELIVKKKLGLTNLMKQVEGDWKDSKLAPAISFCKTKIIHSQSTIKDLLNCIDNLGFIVACINGTAADYVIGCGTKVHLDNQTNYICLKHLTTDLEINAETSDSIKQRSDNWKNLRACSRVTGSTLFRAIGLGTLKEQQTHYDKVYRGVEVPVSSKLQQLFDYGTAQEINAIGTLVVKIIPVYFPQLQYREDGCKILPIGDSYAIISGDGSGIDHMGENKIAFEIKCPIPNKERTTDLHYEIPVYYSTQVLSQLKAKQSLKFCYLSYNPGSTTFIEGIMNDDLWGKVWDSTSELYGKVDATRPTRNKPEQKELLADLKEYATASSFVAEFPSLLSVQCSCESTDDYDNVYGYHTKDDSMTTLSSLNTSLDTLSIVVDKTCTALNDAYQTLRKPAKEILLTVVSDLERKTSDDFDTANYAVPIQYALSGYSLSMCCVRKLLDMSLVECSSRKLNVKAIAFDGQFLELAVSDDCGRPLTICRFMKQFWDQVKRTDKAIKLTTLLNLNKLPSISTSKDLFEHFDIHKTPNSIITISKKEKVTKTLSGKNISKAIQASQSNVKNVETETTSDDNLKTAHLDILQYIPNEIVSELDESMLEILRQTCKAVTDDANTNELSLANETDYKPEDIDFETLIISLIASSDEGTKWMQVSFECFKQCFANAETIKKSFTSAELKVIAGVTETLALYSKMLKPALVNLVCKLYGDGSNISSVRTTNPKSLKALVMCKIKKWPISAVNVAFAQLNFRSALNEWESENAFSGSWNMETENGQQYEIHRWYAQPMIAKGQMIQPIIDPHHLFVNNRARCCSKGISGMGVSSEAWWKVAGNCTENGTGLSLEIAKELRDKQKNSYAQTTFSEKVQFEMMKNGDYTEAEWCRLIRNWYAAIDEGGMCIEKRIECLLAMRDKLLPYLHVGHFPPPGAYVASLPMAQFEGILSNVDRRLQLYGMVQRGSYNQRAVTSLDSETFFSGFQDYDPKGTGVLRPDDIPTALGAAVCLFSQRMDSNRKFYMKTSKKTRVYPEQSLSQNCSADGEMEETELYNCFNTRIIKIKSNQFDLPERKAVNPKRKCGRISSFGVPSRGAEGARSHHKTNEEKILAHRRYGISDDNIDLKN
ncbi:Hypothetical predicted protein [Mytilus galloprovincialis]|uniref:YqaJ viral recombinase domain-containing protein n=2 Tax=Mytilus TaxID=6548 RepID=A0A8B6CF24_MYTGA|nr:Hypothetical predicted protein [Mytilus galloprovincialis]